MKPALFIIAIVASASAIAQQTPDAARIRMPAPPKSPPKSAPRAPQLSNEDLAELLSAQTTAIKALSSKLDSLEERLAKVEKETH